MNTSQIVVRSPYRQWVLMISRILLAVVVGYGFTLALVSLLARLASQIFALQFSASLLGAMLLGFLIYAVVVIVVFATNNLGRTALILVSATLICILLCQTPWLLSAGGG